MNRAAAYAIITDVVNSFSGLTNGEMVAQAGEKTEDVRQGNDGLDYSVSTRISWHRPAAKNSSTCHVAICVSVAPADWGAPHDALEERLIVESTPEA